MDSYGLYFSPSSEDKSFWEKLILKIITKINKIRIDCWNEEKEIIEELRQYCDTIDESFKGMTIFTFKVNDLNKNKLIFEAIEDNKVKWFSLFLMKGNQTLFSSEHNGNEYTISGIIHEEIAEIKKIIPKNSSFHIFNRV